MITTNNTMNILDLMDTYPDGSGKDPFSVRYELIGQLEVTRTVTPSFEFACRLDMVAGEVYGKPDWAEVLALFNNRGAILLESKPKRVKCPSLRSAYRLFDEAAKLFGR